MRGVLLGIIVLSIVGIVLWHIMPEVKEVSVEDAKRFVLDDLRHKYPNADYEILLVKEENTTAPGKRYNIKARVTLFPDSPCPERLHLYYNYPEQGYVTQPPDYITKDCKVWGGDGAPIIYEEEAIIASHTKSGTENVHSYIEQRNATHTVRFDDSEGTWIVTWNAEGTEFFYEVTISTNGSIVSVVSKFNE